MNISLIRLENEEKQLCSALTSQFNKNQNDSSNEPVYANGLEQHTPDEFVEEIVESKQLLTDEEQDKLNKVTKSLLCYSKIYAIFHSKRIKLTFFFFQTLSNIKEVNEWIINLEFKCHNGEMIINDSAELFKLKAKYQGLRDDLEKKNADYKILYDNGIYSLLVKPFLGLNVERKIIHLYLEMSVKRFRFSAHKPDRRGITLVFFFLFFFFFFSLLFF